jgi:hypothetical protein
MKPSVTVSSALALSLYLALAWPSASCVASRMVPPPTPNDGRGLGAHNVPNLAVAEARPGGISPPPGYRMGGSWASLAVSPSQRISNLLVRASSNATVDLGWEHAKVYRMNSGYGSAPDTSANLPDPVSDDSAATRRASCDNLLSARPFFVAERLGAGVAANPCPTAPRATQPPSPRIPSGTRPGWMGVGP